MNQSKSKLWTKDFIVVSSINFFLTLIFYLLMVTFAVYAVDEFHASTSQAGLVTGIFIIGALIGRLFIGRMIVSFSRRKILFIGLILFTSTTSLSYLEQVCSFSAQQTLASFSCFQGSALDSETCNQRHRRLR